MEWLDLVLHFETYLQSWVAMYGQWVYALLFLIIFCETGLVVMPFLPGDSLLFMAGALTASTVLSVEVMIPLLVVAAVSGDSTNYWIGRFAGKRLLARHSRWLRPEHVAKTHEFYERHGGKTVILARFAPIVRTFAPFVAGMGKMTYRHFVGFSMLGSCIWVGGFVTAGRLFGNLPIVKQNLSYIAVLIVVLSLLPAMLGYIKHRFLKAA